MIIEFIKTADLVPYANNSRTHTREQIEQVAASIREFGFTNPVLIDKDNGIIAGHARTLAAFKIGMGEVPCIRLSHLTEAQKKAYVIADNKLALNAGWDEDMLAKEIQDLVLEEFDVDLIGFTAEELDDILNIDEKTQIIEDEAPEPKKEAVSKLGDLWLLGNHRLLCGDSTIIDDVDNLMDGNKADMVFTDPPYLIQTQGGGVLQKSFKKTAERIKEIVDFNPTEFLKVLPNVFEEIMNTYIFCNKDLIPDYINWAKENKYNFNILTWCKKQVVPFTGGHHYSDIEYIMYITKKPIFNNGLKDVSYRKYFILDTEKSICYSGQ